MVSSSRNDSFISVREVSKQGGRNQQLQQGQQQHERKQQEQATANKNANDSSSREHKSSQDYLCPPLFQNIFLHFNSCHESTGPPPVLPLQPPTKKVQIQIEEKKPTKAAAGNGGDGVCCCCCRVGEKPKEKRISTMTESADYGEVEAGGFGG